MLTLKTCAHAIREEEADLSFADFSVSGGSERLYAPPSAGIGDRNESAADRTHRRRYGTLALIAPSGVRVEGLRLEQAAQLLRLLA